MGKAHFLAAALAARALAIDIPSVPTWPSSGRCTDKSLTILSWIISNYTVSGGKTNFQVNNRASESGAVGTVECASDNTCQGNAGNDAMRASIAPGPSGTIVTISEEWVCSDTKDKVIFYANGSTTISQCTGSDCVSPIPYLVNGKLSLPIPLAPTQPSPPPGYDASTCADVGDNQWTVSSVSYKNYTKGQCKQWYQQDQICLDPGQSGNNFIRKGVYLNFTVQNNAIAHQVSCGFTPTYDKQTPSYPLRCTGGDFNEITLDATLNGSAPSFNLKVEELWYCLEDPSKNVNPTALVAAGNTAVPLNCSTSTGLTGTADDIITICTDPVTSHSIAGVQTAKQTLPAFSLLTAYPVQGGCTFDSVVTPTYYLRGLFFETNTFPANDPNSATLNRFTTGLTGPGFADYFFYEQKTALSGSGINSVYSCANYGNGQPIHWNCTYSFDPFNKILTLDKVWQCTDKNAATPLYFDGSGTFDWKVDPYSDCSTSNTSISCYWYDDLNNLQPGIPYSIPKVTVRLTNVPPPQVETVRVDGQWQKNNSTSS